VETNKKFKTKQTSIQKSIYPENSPQFWVDGRILDRNAEKLVIVFSRGENTATTREGHMFTRIYNKAFSTRPR